MTDSGTRVDADAIKAAADSTRLAAIWCVARLISRYAAVNLQFAIRDATAIITNAAKDHFTQAG
jgi:hypothetical protein